MKIKTKISLVTIVSLITCCLVLWGFNYFSTHNLIKDIKEIESCDEKKTYAKLTEIENRGDKSFDSLLIGLLVVIVIGGGLSLVAVTTSLKPVKELTKKIKDFHTSDLKNPIELPKNKDESYDLISSYNTMLNILNQAFEREKRVTANIAHEFKTPLSVLITSCEVLEMKENPTIEDYKKVLEITKSKAEYLSEITTSLLSIHRKTQKLNNVKTNLNNMIDSIIEDLTPKSSEKDISITVNSPNLDIKCDKLLFSQMINNFIENAIKYNVQNGAVNININTAQDNTLEIIIADTGKGISDKDKELVFEPFYRVDDSRNKEYGGVGLGMPFAKVVADLYRGSITIKDNTPVGTKIILSFPNIVC